MRITFTDDYQNLLESLDCFARLKNHEIVVLNKYFDKEEDLASAMNNPEILILNRTRTKISRSLLSKLPNLKIISQTGKNAGHIDISACNAFGVTVLESKGDPVSTAELAWLLIMNGLRQLPQAIQGFKNGNWQINMGRRVKGKIIRIWSYGRIGRMVAKYAKAFDAHVLVWGSERSKKQAQSDGFEIALSKDEFFKTCDVISLHLRLSDRTKEIVTQKDLSQMKSTALLVNTSRAGLIQNGALVEALKNNRPGFAAIDVFDSEPIYDKNNPLLKMDNVICTPHLGYVEKESYELYFGQAISNVLDFIGE